MKTFELISDSIKATFLVIFVLPFILLVLVTGCSTTPKNCQQAAWEDAGQAMANVQYQLKEQLEWDKYVNCTITNGCANAPLLYSVNSGLTSGPYSDTHYRGLSPRQAYDKAMLLCGK
jgi:uncharacterized protein YceK